VVLSVTTGFQDQFRDKVLGVNAHVIIMKSSTDFAEYRDVMDGAQRIDPDVVAVQPFIFLELLATTGNGRISGVAVKGVDPTWSTSVLDLEKHMIAGRPVASLAKVVVGPDELPQHHRRQGAGAEAADRVGDDVTIVVPLSNVDFETWRSKAAPRPRPGGSGCRASSTAASRSTTAG
jgi:hypothetical protein